jgi:protein-tyrosine-phosphatase
MWGTAGGIFLVCTANICRSVYGSAVLAGALGNSGIPLASAGINTVDGSEACPYVRRLVADANLPAPPQLATGARELAVEDLADAALVITFTVRQRGLVARLAPSTRERLFTLREATALATAISSRRLQPGGLEDWAGLLHANRPSLGSLEPPREAPRWWQFGRAPAVTAAPWDIPDAHSRPEATHLERLAVVAEYSQRLGTILAGGHG